VYKLVSIGMSGNPEVLVPVEAGSLSLWQKVPPLKSPFTSVSSREVASDYQ